MELRSIPQPPGESYERCDQCGTPVEAAQRYCVVCGTRRKHVRDPAARFLSTATSRSRTARSRQTATGSGRRSRGPGLLTALAIALVPVAVAVGLLIGRANDGQDAKLLSALRAQKPEVVNVGSGSGGGAAVAASTPTSASSGTRVAVLKSTFSLQSGYAVELKTLPGHGTTEADVNNAEKAAKRKGAPAVGLITQSDFRLTPSPPAGDYVVYSGQYKARADADRALAKLKKAFPAAVVVAVRSTSASAAAPGPVLNKTTYGSFHAVASAPPSKAQLNQGSQIAKSVARKINHNYVGSQKGLPNEVSVP